MTTLSLIQTILPTLAIILVYIYHLVFHLLPVKQQQMLERSAPQAVQMVEQVSASIPNHEKKTFAVNTVKMLFRVAKVPIPSDEAIDTFIESAVFALKQANAGTPLTVKSGDIVRGTPGLAPMPTPDYLGGPPPIKPLGT
ncbi:MAG TPA: phage holin [Ktedonobacteraceae bacterium]|jgi:LL-H family phage holin|nr:phage holin [Ktedonobacteraceae bacterium]